MWAFLGRGVGPGGLGFRRWYATKKAASPAKGKGKPPKKGAQTETKGKKGKAQTKSSGGESASAGLSAAESESLIRQPEELVEDHLFTGSRGIAEITANDINKYYYVSQEDARKYFAEGFSKGLMKEFQASRSSFIQVRGIALEICNRLHYSVTNTFAYNSRELLPYIKHKVPKPSIADAAKATGALESAIDASTAADSFSAAAIQSLQDSAEEESSANEIPSPSPSPAVVKVPERIHRVLKEMKHLILDGPVGCGKTFTLAMIVQWARSQGWLVFYVPSAKEWTRGGFYYLNELTGFWDTPLQAQDALNSFLDSHGEMLGQIKCRISEPIFLGEAAGLGRQPGPQEISLPEGSSLKDLVEKGVSLQTAASNIVVRLRQELDLVTEFPVLIAVDEYNSWFTFSEYFQFLDFRKRREIHAKELGMVNAFRKMHRTRPHFVGAFSQSTAVGKLPLELPDAPQKTRIMVDRFNKEETKAAITYYHRQKVLHNEPQEQAINRLFYLTNGNGIELRKLARYI